MHFFEHLLYSGSSLLVLTIDRLNSWTTCCNSNHETSLCFNLRNQLLIVVCWCRSINDKLNSGDLNRVVAWRIYF